MTSNWDHQPRDFIGGYDTKLKSFEQEPQANHLSAQMLTQMYMNGDYYGCLNALTMNHSVKVVDMEILKASCWTHLRINQKMVLQVLTKIIHENPWNEFAHYELGFNFYKTGQFEQCLMPLKKAFDLNPNAMVAALIYSNNAVNILQLLAKAKSEFQSGDHSKAIETLSYVPLIDTKNDSITQRAKSIVDECVVVKQEPEDRDELDDRLSLTEAYLKTNKLDEASKLLDEREFSGRGWYLKGLLAYKLGLLTQSLKYFNKSLELRPSMVKSQKAQQMANELIELIKAATIQMKLKSNEHAIVLLTKALEIDPGNLRVNQGIFFQRAVAKFNMALVNEAFEDYLYFETLQNQTGMIMDGIKF